MGTMGQRYSGSRFGTIAIEKNFITFENLLEALKVQVNKDLEESIHVEIGQVMIQLGYMKKKEVEEVLHSISKSITKMKQL